MIEREDKFIALEKQINPLLDTNDVIGFSYLLGEIVQKCKNVPKSAMFHTKVDAKKVPTYYAKIQEPIDLSMIEGRVKQHEYKRVAEFLNDLRKMYLNSLQFNGENSIYTHKAKEIYETAEAQVAENRGTLEELERNLNPGWRPEKEEEEELEEGEVKTEVPTDEHPTEDEDEEMMMMEEEENNGEEEDNNG